MLSGAYARLHVRPTSVTEGSRERTKLIPLVAPGRTVAADSGRAEWRVPLDSHLAVRVCDFAGHALAPERNAGIWSKGPADAEIPVQVAARLTVRLAVRVDARTWEKENGFALTTTGVITVLDGLILRLEFRSVQGGERQITVVEWPVLPPGRKLFGPERELVGITPGTWLTVRFLDAQGDSVGEERVVGRCDV